MKCLLSCMALFVATNPALAEQSPQHIGELTPQSLYQRGVQLLQADKIEEAAAQFRQAIKISPDFAPAYNLLGVCYSRMGKPELAHQAFLEAVRFDSHSAEAHNNLGISYLALGKPEQAADQFQESAALNPNDSSSLFNLGLARLRLKQATPALSALLRAQKILPNDTQISLATGEAYFMAGDVESGQAVLARICSAPEGVADFQIAAGEILLNYQRPTDAEGCFLHAAAMDSLADEKILSLASQFAQEGNYQTALGILLPLKERMDRLATYHDLVGVAYSKLGNPTPAIESFKKAIELDPGNEDYYLDLGQALQEYEAYESARGLFQSGVLAHPKSARLYVGLALACLPAARVKEARDAAERAIELEPTLESAYTTLATVCEAEKDWQCLLNDSLRLQKLNPRNHWGWYYEALAQLGMQRSGQSTRLPQIIGLLRRAIELKPAFPLAHLQLGKLFYQQKDYSKSIIELKQAIQINPDYMEAHFLLGMALRRVGDIQHSREQLEIHRRLIAEFGSRHRPHLDVKIEGPK